MYGSDRTGFARELMLEWPDGSIKLYVTFVSLNYRKENCKLFMDGAYIPLWGDGNLKDHVCAFARHQEQKVVLVIVPRFLTQLNQDVDGKPFGSQIWQDSWVVVTEEVPGNKFHNILTDERIEVIERNGRRTLTLDQVFANFPVALLEAT